MTKYYALWYRLGSKDAYLLWHSNAGADEESYVSGLVLDTAGRLLSFASAADLYAYAEQSKMPIKREEPILHNLDVVDDWLREPEKVTVDCQNFLASWNLFDDITSSASSASEQLEDDLYKIYQKLYWGNNLPGTTPEGKHYVPTWTDSEIGRMWDFLNHGLHDLRHRLIDPSPGMAV